MTALQMDPGDLLLVKGVLFSIVASIIGALIANYRASKGNVQVARYGAELKLLHDDRSAWREALNAMRMDIGVRVSTLEEKIKHVPSSSDFAELEGVVSRVAMQYDNLGQQQTAIRASLNRIEDYLLKGKRP